MFENIFLFWKTKWNFDAFSRFTYEQNSSLLIQNIYKKWKKKKTSICIYDILRVSLEICRNRLTNFFFLWNGEIFMRHRNISLCLFILFVYTALILASNVKKQILSTSECLTDSESSTGCSTHNQPFDTLNNKKVSAIINTQFGKLSTPQILFRLFLLLILVCPVLLWLSFRWVFIYVLFCRFAFLIRHLLDVLSSGTYDHLLQTSYKDAILSLSVSVSVVVQMVFAPCGELWTFSLMCSVNVPWFVAVVMVELDVGARLYVAEFMINFRTFFSGWKTIIYILGTKRQRRATDALRLIDIHNVVIWIWNAFSVPKYIGTNASQIMQVVYIENPMNFDSLKFSGMFLVLTA